MAAATPCHDHSDRAQKHTSRFKQVIAFQGEGMDRLNLSNRKRLRRVPGDTDHLNLMGQPLSPL